MAAKGISGTELDLKITFLCRLNGGFDVYSYPTNVVNRPGSLCASAASTIRAHVRHLHRLGLPAAA